MGMVKNLRAGQMCENVLRQSLKEGGGGTKCVKEIRTNSPLLHHSFCTENVIKVHETKTRSNMT